MPGSMLSTSARCRLCCCLFLTISFDSEPSIHFNVALYPGRLIALVDMVDLLTVNKVYSCLSACWQGSQIARQCRVLMESCV